MRCSRRRSVGGCGAILARWICGFGQGSWCYIPVQNRRAMPTCGTKCGGICGGDVVTLGMALSFVRRCETQSAVVVQLFDFAVSCLRAWASHVMCTVVLTYSCRAIQLYMYIPVITAVASSTALYSVSTAVSADCMMSCSCSCSCTALALNCRYPSPDHGTL